MMVKTAVVAAMPIASDTIAVPDNHGERRTRRSPKRMS